MLPRSTFISLVLLQVPVHSSPVLSSGIVELCIIVGPQEVCDRVPVVRGERKYAVQCGAQLVAREEAQTIAHINNGVARSRSHEPPLVVPVCRAQDLEAPLLREEDGQGAQVRVHVLADFAGCFVQRRVVEEEDGTLGGCVVAVGFVEILLALEAEAGGDAVEEDLGYEVALVLEFVEGLVVLLHDGGERPTPLQLGTANLGVR